MVSIKIIADGLSKQIEQAIEGKANIEQADALCKSVDSIIKLARLQIEMAQIDWGGSDELPVLEMEKTGAKPSGEGAAKALTATALVNNQVEIVKLGDRLMNWIYKRQGAFGVNLAIKELNCEDKKDSIHQNISYWASKGHLEKTGSGALASYRIIDREFFKPKEA